MSSLDQSSQAIGRLQGQVENLQESVDKLTNSVDGLLAFKWKVAGVMAFIASLVEGLHLFAGR